MLLKVDQLKNDELYISFQKILYMLIIKFFAQVSLQLFGALENMEGFSRATATLGPLLDLMGRARAT